MAFSTSEVDEAFDYLFKIILIGDSNVGKTCVVHRFKSGQYYVKQQNTIGVDFTVRSLEIEGKKVKIQVWDTAGQERFRTITQSYYRSAHGAILAYDMTKRSTFESIPHWIHEIEKYGAANLVLMLIEKNCPDLESLSHLKSSAGLALVSIWKEVQGRYSEAGNGKPPLNISCFENPTGVTVSRLQLDGNKSDETEKRQVLFEDACTLAEKHGLLAVLETSAKEAQNVDEVFILMAKELMARNALQLSGESAPTGSIYLDTRPVMTTQLDKSDCSC